MLSAVYPMDEPDFWLMHPNEAVTANADIRSVMLEFPELHATKIAVVFSSAINSGNNYLTHHMDQYDWVGFDDYGPAQWIFDPPLYSEYDIFKSHVGAKQRVLLVPGGTTHPSDGIPPGVNPTPSFASVFGSDRSVIAMLPFIWEEYAGLGIGSHADRLHNFCVVGAPIKGVLTSVCPP